jgi:hypothetical protein
MNHPILESDDFDSLFTQKCRTFRIILGSKLSKMRRAVQFDRNVAFDAEKIDNIATYAVLPAESLAEDLTGPKVLPQGGFRGCGIVSQFSTAGFQRRDVDQIEVSFGHTAERASMLGSVD